jgi:hypothetical protein
VIEIRSRIFSWRIGSRSTCATPDDEWAVCFPSIGRINSGRSDVPQRPTLTNNNSLCCAFGRDRYALERSVLAG